MDDFYIFNVIGVEEASIYSSLSKRHIRYLLEKRKINGKKIGREWITTRSEVNTYLRSNPKPGPKLKKS